MPGTNAVLDYQSQLLFVAGLLQTGARAVVTSDDLTIQDSDFTLVVQRSPAGASAITLPDAADLSDVPGSRFLRIFDGSGDASTNNITITATGALINGAASIVIDQDWGFAELEWMGTYWQWHQGAASGGSVPLHADTHKSGASDDLLSAPGPIGDGTPDTVGATTLTAIIGIFSQVARLLNVSTPGAIAGAIQLFASTTNAAGMRYANGNTTTLANLGASGAASVRLDVTSATLADNATFDYDNGGKGGLMLVFSASATGSQFGIVSFAQNATTTLSGGPAYTNFSVTLTSAGKINVGASGGKVRIENKIGSPIDVWAFVILGVAA